MARSIVSVIILLFLVGCWDRVEIEERGFVVGAGVDLTEEKKNVMLTQQFVVPTALEAAKGGSGAGEGAYLNDTTRGDTIFEVVRDVAAKASRTPFYTHMQTLVVSEDAAKTDYFEDVMDYFIREPEMRRGTIILISKGKAKEILDILPKNERIPAMYIQSISENTYKNAEIYPKTRIGSLHKFLLKDQSFAITMIEKAGKRLVLTDTAVIHGHQNSMVGTLNRTGTIGLNFVKNEIDGGFVKTKLQNETIIYDIYNSNTDVKVNAKNKDSIQFEIIIQSEGAIGESFLSRDYMQGKTIQDFEAAIEDRIKEMVMYAVKQCQTELHADVLDLGDKLRQHNYTVWEQVKNDWDHGEDYFSKSSVTLDVNVIIRSSGAVDKTKNEQ